MKRIVEWIKRLVALWRKRKAIPPKEPDVVWSTDVEDSPDNVLLHPGRLIRWVSTSGKHIETYETGFQERWFLSVIAAHWTGIRYILTKKAGEKYRNLESIPTHVRLEIVRKMPVPGRTVKQAFYADTGEPVEKMPDHVIWYVRFGGPKGPVLVFGHSHAADTMKGRSGFPYAEWVVNGKTVFHWVCNHPHVVITETGEQLRCDIRYTGGDRKPVVVKL